jgi:hypothetical protein
MSSPRCHIAPDRERSIAVLAEGLALDAFGFGPVDPERLIEETDGLTMSRGSYGDSFDGMLEYDGAGFHIYANMDRLSRLKEGRGAFTLAHELGHYYIDEHRHWMEEHPGKSLPSLLFSSLAKDAPHEREADCFASSLILPTPSFRARVRAPAPSAEVILDTADFFRCSITSTAIRFCELEPFPCAIIRWSTTGTCQWARMSPRVQGTFGTAARDLTGIRSASLTAEVLRGGSRPSRPRITVTEAWFPWAEERAQRKHARLEHYSATIDEHVIPMGDYGCLTVLCGHALANLPPRTTN